MTFRSRRRFRSGVCWGLLLGAGLMAAGHAVAASPAAEKQPNVVLVMCDDLGWGDVGFNGNRVIKTPHLDQMAAAGLRFARFYSAAPVCSPTRGSVITGRHPYRYGVTFANRGFMKPREVTLAELLRDQGYATGMFGKWHLGTLTTTVQDANRGGPGSEAIFSPPRDHGFEVCFCTESKVPTFDPLRVPRTFPDGGSRHTGWDSLEDDAPFKHYGTHYWNERGEVVEENLRGDDSRIIMDRAVPFIERAVRDERPFLAVIWFHAPHLPVVAGPRHRRPYAEFDLHRRNYYGCITALDEQVGRLRAALRKLGVQRDTMLWFCSDNGPEGNDRAPGSAGPYRGRKRSLYEGGVRVPALLEWPAVVTPGGTTDAPAVTSDYLPTIWEAVRKQPFAVERPIDGVSLLPLIRGETWQRPTRIGFQSGKMAALTDRRYKLVVVASGKNERPTVELYDLRDDPSEQRDLASSHPDIARRMHAELTVWQASCAASARGEDD